jgi:hypothetical protein
MNSDHRYLIPRNAMIVGNGLALAIKLEAELPRNLGKTGNKISANIR